jgi:hypothetical protein
MVAAGIVAGAVAIGGVTGVLIGIPGQSGATTSDSSTTTTPGSEAPDGADHLRGGGHVRGFFGMRNGSDGVFAAAAEALDLSTEELMEKLSDGETTIADVAEQQDVDLQTVIDAMEAVASQNIEDLVNNPLPAPPHGLKDGRGHGFGFAFGFPGLHESFDSVASALGITTDELRDELRNGQSIADIAKAKNVDLDAVVDTLVKDATAKLDQAVQDEMLTQEEADELKAALKKRITDRLNGDLPDLPAGFGRFGGFRMHGGPGGPGWVGPGPGSPEEANPTAAAV